MMSSTSSNFRRFQVADPFGSVAYAASKSPSGLVYANAQSGRNFVDAPRDVKLPARDAAWLIPRAADLVAEWTASAHAMFVRECVLYCSILKGFFGVFRCKNETCSCRKKDEPFFMVQLSSGFGNLARHAKTCFGKEEYDAKIEKAREVVNEGLDAQRMFFTSFFRVVRSFRRFFPCLLSWL
jgi:hypothetical protein